MRTSSPSRSSSPLVLATALVGGAGVTLTTEANAAVIFTPGISNTSPLSIPVTFDGVYIDVVTGNTSTAANTNSGWDINPFSVSGSDLSWFLPSSNTGMIRLPIHPDSPANIAPGTLVDADSPISGVGNLGSVAFGTNAGEWQTNSVNYVGFRFFNEATSAIHYGYAAVEIGSSAVDPARRILAIAYEDQPGQGITVGAVPEPASALLATGALGLMAFRRRRQVA